MTFNSEQNKGMLWSILVENGVFNGIDESFFSDVKSVFENGILNLEKKQDDLINLNKEFIQIMLSEIPKFREKQVNKKIPLSETFKTSDQIKAELVEQSKPNIGAGLIEAMAYISSALLITWCF